MMNSAHFAGDGAAVADVAVTKPADTTKIPLQATSRLSLPLSRQLAMQMSSPLQSRLWSRWISLPLRSGL